MATADLLFGVVAMYDPFLFQTPKIHQKQQSKLHICNAHLK